MRRTLLFVLLTIAIHTFSQQNNSPLCFTARNGGVIVKFDIKNVTHTIQYSTNGTTWQTYTSNTDVPLSAYQSIYFRAETNQDSAWAFGNIGDYFTDGTDDSRFYFSSSNGGVVEGSGNIMSLYGPDCPDLPLRENAFTSMFLNDTLLITPPSLPATTLADKCYMYMFCGCISLKTAPTLPATTLTKSCYRGMFHSCESLITAPVLPADTLAEECYAEMFCCCHLKTPPALPATVLAEGCYSFMFSSCFNLTTAPALPALVMEFRCYENMFCHCQSLKVAPDLPATILASGCYSDMFAGCTSLTASPTISAVTLGDYCCSNMFFGCSSLKSLPVLNATTLPRGCYCMMFYCCSSLILNHQEPGKKWTINATSVDEDALKDMFSYTGGTACGTPSENGTYYVASDPTSAADNVEEDNKEYSVFCNSNQIIVDGAELISIFDASGKTIYNGCSTSETSTFQVPVSGIYFVICDNKKNYKIVVR